MENQQQDGIWTGYDFQDSSKDLQVENGIVKGITDDGQVKVETSQNLLGSVDDYMTRPNVIRAMSALTE